MKDFEDFKAYMREHGQEVHEDIVRTVNEAVEKCNFSDEEFMARTEMHRRSWVELGFMKMIEQYHNWLNS